MRGSAIEKLRFLLLVLASLFYLYYALIEVCEGHGRKELLIEALPFLALLFCNCRDDIKRHPDIPIILAIFRISSFVFLLSSNQVFYLLEVGGLAPLLGILVLPLGLTLSKRAFFILNLSYSAYLGVLALEQSLILPLVSLLDFTGLVLWHAAYAFHANCIEQDDGSLLYQYLKSISEELK